MNEYLKYLAVDLPEDIAKLKACGEFGRAKRVIDRRIGKGIPEALKKRLEMEKEIMDIISESYPYDYEQTLDLLKRSFEDFKEEELEELWETDAADWYYLNGRVHFKDDIVANLVKTIPKLAERVIDKKDLLDKEGNFSLLDEVTEKMKKQKKMGYRIRIRSSIKVKEEFERIGKTIRVHLPIPIEYAQVKNFRLIETSHEPFRIGEAGYPARTVYFEKVYEGGEEFFVDYEYETHMVYKEPDPEKVLASQPTFCTEELPPHIVFDFYLKELVDEVVGEEKNPLLKARKIYDFITCRVMYSFVRPYFSITNIPLYAATSLKGDCGIQALLFITMCRIAKIPARWQAGLYVNPLSIGNHDWAQFYVAPYGWLFADCSFGGSAWREGAVDRWNFYFGNLEPFRMPAVSDFQHDFDPALRYLRRDPYDNQNGEVEYEDARLKQDEYEMGLAAVSLEEIEI